MSVRGSTINISLNPNSNKELEAFEKFVPVHIDIRNGQLSQAGHWIKRPGFTENWDVGVDSPIDLLIPKDVGFAVTEEGSIYLLEDTPSLLSLSLDGNTRPQWDQHNDLIIIVDGGAPIAIDNKVTSLLGGSPPRGKFISRHGPYTIISGHDPTEFKWCASGNPENWTTGDSGFANVQKTGGDIRYHTTFKDTTYFFTDNNIELWTNLGGTTPFVNMQGALIEKGISASYSVVQANDQLYFFGKDGDFYSLSGLTLKVISQNYRKELDKLSKLDIDDLYGFDFRKENIVRWFAPNSGKCFTFDYSKGIFSEDNSWFEGDWQRLPINSYMELNNKQYFGSFNLDGLVHEWSIDNETDDGNTIRVYRKMRIKPSNNGRQVRFNRLGFRFKRGFSTDGNFMYRTKIDEGFWSREKLITMGDLQDRDPYVPKLNIGIGREIQIETVQTGSNDSPLTHIDLTVKELGR